MASPYRYFDKKTVIDCMMSTKMVAGDLTGHNRLNSKGKTLEFDTFSALADPVDYFAEAMSIELEHGSAGAEEGKDITGDCPLRTAQIAAAHLKGVERGKPRPYVPFVDYYDWLMWMERLHEAAMNRSR